MVELYQFPWSPFCLVQKRLLDYGRIPHRTISVPPTDRSVVWRLTRQRYYQVPVLRDGRNVLFETTETSQVLAKYLDGQFQLGLFPRQWNGLQQLLWRQIEEQVEGIAFRLNDIYYKDYVAAKERLNYLRFKERKFGRGCLDQWRAQAEDLLAGLGQVLLPYDQMLATRPYLLDAEPRFVDFDLYGMLANFLYSGHYRLPAALTNLAPWYERISQIRLPAAAATKRSESSREKLHS